MLRFLSLVIVAVLMMQRIPNAYGCYCDPAHPQQEFCTVDYVIKAKVREKIFIYDADNTTEMPVEVKYVLKIKKIFKQTPAFEELNDTTVAFTSSKDSLCGVDLNVNEDYLISGNVNGGRMDLHYCSWIEKYNNPTSIQKRGVRFLYKNGCKCQVFRCFGNGCNNPAAFGVDEDHNCAWERGLPGDCYARKGICKKLGDGRCCWKRTHALKNCAPKEHSAHWC
uniref:Tissue inhibitor of metalloproteinase n=1 Tax=Tegillarca granosa TaxID=220873 RepID=J7F7Y4_TEGGR|nr:tissue inhibitor of metalloproteinase [Tegillarca granosa]